MLRWRWSWRQRIRSVPGNVAIEGSFGHRRLMFGDVARLGLAVRDRRARLGLSQTDLWRSGGPSNSTLTNIENGRQVPVSSFTLRKLDEALKWGTGCAYSLLHGDEGPVSVPMPGAELRAHNLAAAAAEARRALRGQPDRLPRTRGLRIAAGDRGGSCSRRCPVSGRIVCTTRRAPVQTAHAVLRYPSRMGVMRTFGGFRGPLPRVTNVRSCR